jgi:hypothetical protein
VITRHRDEAGGTRVTLGGNTAKPRPTVAFRRASVSRGSCPRSLRTRTTSVETGSRSLSLSSSWSNARLRVAAGPSRVDVAAIPPSADPPRYLSRRLNRVKVARLSASRGGREQPRSTRAARLQQEPRVVPEQLLSQLIADRVLLEARWQGQLDLVGPPPLVDLETLLAGKAVISQENSPIRVRHAASGSSVSGAWTTARSSPERIQPHRRERRG